MKNPITIDIYELMKLLDSSYHSSTILSATIMDKFIGEWYECLDDNERERIFYYAKNTLQDSGEEIFNRFLARYDPDNQYRVTCQDGDKKEARDMYLYEDRYWDGTRTFAPEELIINVEKLKQ